MTNKPSICAGLIANMVRFSATDRLKKILRGQSVRILTLNACWRASRMVLLPDTSAECAGRAELRNDVQTNTFEMDVKSDAK
ncbi:hypothetical protein [Bradyrhizobium canariense]|uniref:hypothetical protein n=1 Tax=Bradyrhizobium canariense TaxID=255045 RepID=UPI001B8A42C8|nr:hypothetical protein [Bradyrhizobium canariense]MBR0953635.1 hypothetical protein [Bradyrhizobium canariense]